MRNLRLEELTTEQKIGMLICARNFYQINEEDLEHTIDMIRNQGYDGLCFADSFAMMAILQKYGEENLYGMAIAAGNDIVLPNYRSLTKTAYEMLLKNYRDGAFTEERLNEAVRRVQATQAIVGAGVEDPNLFTEEDKVNYYNIAKDNEKVLLAATRHKEVVFITYCNTRPYLGTDCMTRRVESVINALIMSDKVSAVVHFGNPFALKPVKHVSRRLFGYMMPQSQLHAIEVLAGKLPAKGKLPYNIQFD